MGVWAATWAREGKVRDNPKFLNPKGDEGTRQKHSKSVFFHFVTDSLQIAGFSVDFHFASNIESFNFARRLTLMQCPVSSIICLSIMDINTVAR